MFLTSLVTFIYRGVDVVSAWAYAGLQAPGLGITAIAFVAIPMTGLWVVIALYLGKQHQRLADARAETGLETK